MFISRAGKGRRRPVRKARMARKGKKAAPTTRPAAVALIKSVMAREIETKYVSEIISNVGYNSPITNADILSCLPKCVQTDSSNLGSSWQRQGTTISPRSLVVRAHVALTPVTRSTAIVVHYFLLTSKTYKSVPALASANMFRLLKNGGNSMYVPFDGTIPNSQFPVNTEEYNVLQRGSFHLQKNTGNVQDSVDTGNQPLVGPVYKDLVFKLKTPAKLVYDQDNIALPRGVQYPNGYAPFLVFGYTHQDGTAVDNLNTDLTVIATSHMWFDDA